MDAILQKVMGITIIIFMVGNLLEVGLRLHVSEAFAALRNVRFVVTSLAWRFVLGPALATLMGVANAPQGAITMCILGIFLGAVLSGFAAAALLKRFGAPAAAQNA
jgi:BASS family bile acid:Na+ symporter